MKYWNSKLKNMTEYIPGEQPQNLDKFIKLNTNENAFPPSENVLKAIKEAANGDLRRYPSPFSDQIRELFASQNGIQKDNIFVANGSDEIFTLIFRGFIENNGKAAFSYPSYSLYYTMSEANGIKYDKIELDSNFNVDFKNFLSKKYDRIIVDSPPVTPVTDALILAAICDITLLVLRADKSTKKLSQQARDGLLSVGAHVLGTVVNDVSKKSRYGLYGSHGQYYGYYGKDSDKNKKFNDKKTVFKMYKRDEKYSNNKPASKAYFHEIWKTKCPHIKIRR